MEVLNDELYYVDSNHEIYKAKLHSNYFFNSILSWDSHIKQDPDKKKDVTDIDEGTFTHKTEQDVYLGGIPVFDEPRYYLMRWNPAISSFTEKDYEDMSLALIYGEKPVFAELINSMNKLELLFKKV